MALLDAFVAEQGHALRGKILRLHGHDDGIGGGQRVDGEHAEGRHAVYEGVVVAALGLVEPCFERSLAVHGGDERHLCARQLDVRGHQVNALGVLQYPGIGFQRLVAGDRLQMGRQRGFQLVGIAPAERCGEVALRVGIY